VVLGLGLVIFFHELGHFAVAKWCGVFVERFSIGLGHPILRWKYGETEYALGWLPFGGYVKMLGQDDMDPGQMVDDQVAENPRAYSAKNVPQRMAIISAGVIMNVLTGLLFFMLAFRSGVEMMDRTIGYVQVGMPAWTYGLKSGDVIEQINSADVVDYGDIKRNTALSRGAIDIRGKHADGTPFQIELEPVRSKITRVVGVGPSYSLKLLTAEESKEGAMMTYPGTVAEKAGFQPGDQIIQANDQPVKDFLELSDYLGRHASEEIEFTVLRTGSKGEPASEQKVRVAPEKFRSLGMKMSMGKVVALRNGSLAAKAGLLPGDKISQVDGLDVDKDLDPFRLSEYFSSKQGQTVTIKVMREVAGGSPEAHSIEIVPDDIPAWAEPPAYEGSPLSIPSIGLAYTLVPSVFSVEPGSPAAAKGIQKLDTIIKMEFELPPGVERDAYSDKPLVLDVKGMELNHALWMMQESVRSRKIKLTIQPADSKEVKTVEIEPVEVADWFVPSTRGINFPAQTIVHKADSLADAFPMAWRYTSNSITDIYLTLRGLITRDISHKGLSGPIGIAKMAYRSSQVGLSTFVLFLGIISINLAVINFLPIPVLDGGHMVFLLWEGITRSKPSEKVQILATYVGLCFLASLMIFVIFQDLFVSKI
jgi:regulator of sigma E protease